MIVLEKFELVIQMYAYDAKTNTTCPVEKIKSEKADEIDPVSLDKYFKSVSVVGVYRREEKPLIDLPERF